VTPRLFTYSAAEIAASLVAVGAGASYRAAASAVGGRGGRGPDGNSVADWVEIFAPVIFARSGTTRWPRAVAIGSLPFRVRSLDASGRPLPRDLPAFQILGALESGGNSLVALKAFPGAYPGRARSLWKEFLHSRAGAPAQVVCDPDLVAAIESAWTPAPLTILCHSQLRGRLRELLRDEGVFPGDPLANAAERALDGLGEWREFVDFHRPRRLRQLERWIGRYGERIAWQLAHARAADTTTDVLEQKLGLLREQLSGRRGNLRNRERTNRLLMLVQLELNGLADERGYARIIEEELLARGGRADRRRAILDPGGSSLRP